ncbi:MAG: hypothetical protein IT489_04520 [Gammaproteobacteria bacterium]|nr:hypothetical protein [Gammaproteobacteria bacterium]
MGFISFSPTYGLIGVQATTQIVIVSDDNLVRCGVRVGPYKGLKDLEQARIALQRNDIEYMRLGQPRTKDLGLS